MLPPIPLSPFSRFVPSEMCGSRGWASVSFLGADLAGQRFEFMGFNRCFLLVAFSLLSLLGVLFDEPRLVLQGITWDAVARAGRLIFATIRLSQASPRVVASRTVPSRPSSCHAGALGCKPRANKLGADWVLGLGWTAKSGGRQASSSSRTY